MTLEQQRALMTQGSAKLAAASHQQPASGLQSSAHVRAVQLGSDREGRAHLRLSCASLVTGAAPAVAVLLDVGKLHACIELEVPAAAC